MKDTLGPVLERKVSSSWRFESIGKSPLGTRNLVLCTEIFFYCVVNWSVLYRRFLFLEPED